MHPIAVTLIVLLAILVVSAVLVTILAYISAPRGYEDENGFHEFAADEDKAGEREIELNLRHT